MTVSNLSYLSAMYQTTVGMGEAIVSSDFTMVIEGYESLYLLCKQAPWPELSPAGEIEVPMPLGSARWQAQQVKTWMQGSVAFKETTQGIIRKTLESMIAQNNSRGALFDAVIYEGDPSAALHGKRLRDCFLVLDPIDRDWENRGQIMLVSGNMFFHYFGETVEGTSTDYR